MYEVTSRIEIPKSSVINFYLIAFKWRIKFYAFLRFTAFKPIVKLLIT